MKLTKHASVRQQQRGIPPIVIDLLIDYGTVERAGKPGLSMNLHLSASTCISFRQTR